MGSFQRRRRRRRADRQVWRLDGDVAGFARRRGAGPAPFAQSRLSRRTKETR